MNLDVLYRGLNVEDLEKKKSEELKKYNKNLLAKAHIEYEVANAARAKGLDPEIKTEIPLAEDMAARTEGLVGPPNVAQRIREILKEKDRDEMVFQLIKEMVDGKFGTFETKEKLAEQCIRTGLTILTEAVVAASLEGVSRVEIHKNQDGSEYLSIYFAGPIRSAGGTGQAQTVVLGDYVRTLLDLDVMKPTKTEIERYVEEVNLYNDVIARLQYHPPDDDVKWIFSHCPVCIDGESTSDVEVSGYRDLPRFETNRVRGGICLVSCEGIALKAKKVLKFAKKANLDWSWLEHIIKVPKKSDDTKTTASIKTAKFMKDIVGGRPIFAFPSAKGGFRLRYGRARHSGLNAKCIHPASMYVLDEFPAIATQFKIETPGKGMALAPCDKIMGPVVRLINGDVVEINSVSQALELKKSISKILFVGDMLISYGDYLKANHKMQRPGFCEEWWDLIVKEKNLDLKEINATTAVDYARKFNIPLHPKYTYFYSDLTKDELKLLLTWISKADIDIIKSLTGRDQKRLVIQNSPEKKILENLCIPHIVREDRIIIEDANAVIEALGIPNSVNRLNELEDETVLSFLSKVADFPIWDKAGTYIGARMGRPEKAKPRKMNPAPHGLVPLGTYGGKTRSIIAAADKGKISIDIANVICPKCRKSLYSYTCPDCNERAIVASKCTKCGKITDKKVCPVCDSKVYSFHKQIIDFREDFKKLRDNGVRIPDKIKGVKGMMSDEKYFEPLAKSVFRAQQEVFLFKDGTVRFDSSNLPLMFFKPKEIGLTIEQVKKLDYEVDFEGKALYKDDQIIELKPQDMIIPEAAAEYLYKTSKFVDNLLRKFYGLEPYYNYEKKEDVVGSLLIGLAPHTSAGVLMRVLGFTKGRCNFSHPFAVTARRRDCDGDEDAIMLLVDALINFSKKYLPTKIGGKMDAPLVLTSIINPSEVDDQSHEMETVYGYDLKFYDDCCNGVSPGSIELPLIKQRLGNDNECINLGFTHDTTAIDMGPSITKYVQMKSMEDKVMCELELAEKIRAVNEAEIAERIINFHFMRDLYGNLRAFGQQRFRCTDCNEKYRRPPLSGKCMKCGGKLLLTVYKGGIAKYLKLSQRMADKYHLSDYIKQRLSMLESDLDIIFTSDKIKQHSLADFM